VQTLPTAFVAVAPEPKEAPGLVAVGIIFKRGTAPPFLSQSSTDLVEKVSVTSSMRFRTSRLVWFQMGEGTRGGCP